VFDEWVNQPEIADVIRTCRTGRMELRQVRELPRMILRAVLGRHCVSLRVRRKCTTTLTRSTTLQSLTSGSGSR
jgi:hypothetical protein